MVSYYALLALSWNLIMGFTGLLSFAHTALAAVGGYTTALLVTKMSAPPLGAMLAGGALAGVASFLLGIVCLRLHGFYLCLVTWAFAEMVSTFLKVQYQVTGGTMGISLPTLFPGGSATASNVYLGVSLVVTQLVAIEIILRTRVGLYLRSLRDDQMASEALGVNPILWRLFSFSFSGFWAGLAGAFYALSIGVIDPSVGSLAEMGMVILIVIMGGIGTKVGPILGSVIVVVVSELLRGSLAAMSTLIFAVLVIVTMRFFRGGFSFVLDRLRVARQRSGV
jgi:branched-chain amino acid transport system permease protein